MKFKDRMLIFQKYINELNENAIIKGSTFDTLTKEFRIIETSVMYLSENFKEKGNELELGRKFQLDIIDSTLKVIIERLITIKKNIDLLKEIQFCPHPSTGFFLKVLNRSPKKQLVHQIKKDAYFVSLHISQVERMYTIHSIFRKSLVDYELNKQDIRKGDVLLSYKTHKYLYGALLSRLIAIASRSNITHASIVSGVYDDQIEHINPSPDNEHRIKVEPLKIKKDEILFVMRPKLPTHLKIKFRKELDELAQEIQQNRVEYHFSEYKQWYASFEGFIYTNIIVLFHKMIFFKNIFREKNAYFCSEFLDFLFKKVGIYLVPRSEYDSIIGPAELVYSPWLGFVEILYNDSDIEIINSENITI